MEAQIQFLQKIRNLSQGQYSFADELAEVLGLSADSIYRRIRGETALSVDELLKICRHYKVSPDILNETDSGFVNFHYNLLQNAADFENYLTSFLASLQMLKKAGKSAQIIYAADDVPIFHHFNFTEHAAFKMFYWMKSVLNMDIFAGKKFSYSLIKPELLRLGKEIYEAYCQVPSIEIWTEESLNSTLNQILYYWESGLFENPKEIGIIIEQTYKLIDLIQKQAEAGSKTLDIRNRDNFLMYHTEIQIGNNCVLVTAGEQKMVYIRHQTFNTLRSTNPNFCKETQQWLQNEIRKSLPISGVAEKQRYQFFQKIKQKIDKLANKVG
ncbi:helix-turn-helix domain-containing protein [Thermoflexibacter ruber]|uniref:Helix-turn-helix n=1 Tax=Thermoflexibacter ruber TaxID=1003 RepID=A0A1I2BHU4_9BACT|nr:helix-turn-helix transcriptional regulator [Thermoflexibacter ruber]SFE55507.1 Helix-turn-helix [Thermoflexibacter ruber]